MIRLSRVPSIGVAVCVSVGLAGALASACGQKRDSAPPMATPSLTLSRDKVPLGGPVDVTYKFVVAPDAKFAQNYRVMMHVVDPNEELMWTDDHDPPTPTTEWKPGQTVEYTRTVFVPVYPYVGEASITVGLYSTKASEPRVPLAGEDVGQRAYKVARIQLAPQSEAVFSVYKEGWHPAEQAEHNAMVEWHWTKKSATLAVRNPKKDSVLYLDLDNPGGVFNDPQQVSVSIGTTTLDQFTLTPKKAVLRRIALPAAALGTGDNVDVRIDVDKTFVPSRLSPDSKDPRELGVRVFHAAVVEPSR